MSLTILVMRRTQVLTHFSMFSVQTVAVVIQGLAKFVRKAALILTD